MDFKTVLTTIDDLVTTLETEDTGGWTVVSIIYVDPNYRIVFSKSAA